MFKKIQIAIAILCFTMAQSGCAVAQPIAKPSPQNTPPSSTVQVIVVVLDDSGSMSGQKMPDANYALSKVISELPTNTRIGVYALNQGWVSPLSDNALTVQKKQEMIDSVYKVGPTGGTPLGVASKFSIDELLKMRRTLGYGANYRLLLITDGAANDQNDFTTNIGLIKSRGIGVDCIGVQMDSGSKRSILETEVNYTDVSNRDQLVTAIGEVFAEKVSDGSKG